MTREQKKKAAEATARYRKRHSDKVRERRKTYFLKEREALLKRKSNPFQWLTQILPGLRLRSKKSGLECTINNGDLELPTVCPALGVKLIYGARAINGKTPHPHAPSVDRVDNSKGYSKENCRIISYRANLLKKNATVEEIRGLLKYMENAI